MDILSFTRLIDRLNQAVGRTVSWFTLAMVLVSFVVVLARYVFEAGWIWLQELVIWMHAVVFLLGAAYTLQEGEHVRVDVLYRRMTPRGRAWVEIVGALALLVPTCLYFLFMTMPYVMNSWQRSESSREPGGLPFPFVPMAKTSIVLMAVLVLLQGLVMAIRAGLFLRGRVSAEAAGLDDPHGGFDVHAP